MNKELREGEFYGLANDRIEELLAALAAAERREAVLAETVLNIQSKREAAEERAQAAKQSNAELTTLGIDRELALEDSRTQVRELRKALGRASYVAEHLLQQVPEFTGVVSPDGHREDDYIAEQLHAEIQGWAVLARSAGRAET